MPETSESAQPAEEWPADWPATVTSLEEANRLMDLAAAYQAEETPGPGPLLEPWTVQARTNLPAIPPHDDHSLNATTGQMSFKNLMNLADQVRTESPISTPVTSPAAEASSVPIDQSPLPIPQNRQPVEEVAAQVEGSVSTPPAPPVPAAAKPMPSPQTEPAPVTEQLPPEVQGGAQPVTPVTRQENQAAGEETEAVPELLSPPPPGFVAPDDDPDLRRRLQSQLPQGVQVSLPRRPRPVPLPPKAPEVPQETPREFSREKAQEFMARLNRQLERENEGTSEARPLSFAELLSWQAPTRPLGLTEDEVQALPQPAPNEEAERQAPSTPPASPTVSGEMPQAGPAIPAPTPAQTAPPPGPTQAPPPVPRIPEQQGQSATATTPPSLPTQSPPEAAPRPADIGRVAPVASPTTINQPVVRPPVEGNAGAMPAFPVDTPSTSGLATPNEITAAVEGSVPPTPEAQEGAQPVTPVTRQENQAAGEETEAVPELLSPPPPGFVAPDDDPDLRRRLQSQLPQGVQVSLPRRPRPVPLPPKAPEVPQEAPREFSREKAQEFMARLNRQLERENEGTSEARPLSFAELLSWQDPIRPFGLTEDEVQAGTSPNGDTAGLEAPASPESPSLASPNIPPPLNQPTETAETRLTPENPQGEAQQKKITPDSNTPEDVAPAGRGQPSLESEGSEGMQASQAKAAQTVAQTSPERPSRLPQVLPAQPPQRGEATPSRREVQMEGPERTAEGSVLPRPASSEMSHIPETAHQQQVSQREGGPENAASSATFPQFAPSPTAEAAEPPETVNEPSANQVPAERLETLTQDLAPLPVAEQNPSIETPEKGEVNPVQMLELEQAHTATALEQALAPAQEEEVASSDQAAKPLPSVPEQQLDLATAMPAQPERNEVFAAAPERTTDPSPAASADGQSTVTRGAETVQPDAQPPQAQPRQPFQEPRLEDDESAAVQTSESLFARSVPAPQPIERERSAQTQVSPQLEQPQTEGPAQTDSPAPSSEIPGITQPQGLTGFQQNPRSIVSPAVPVENHQEPAQAPTLTDAGIVLDRPASDAASQPTETALSSQTARLGELEPLHTIAAEINSTEVPISGESETSAQITSQNVPSPEVVATPTPSQEARPAGPEQTGVAQDRVSPNLNPLQPQLSSEAAGPPLEQATATKQGNEDLLSDQLQAASAVRSTAETTSGEAPGLPERPSEADPTTPTAATPGNASLNNVDGATTNQAEPSFRHASPAEVRVPPEVSNHDPQPQHQEVAQALAAANRPAMAHVPEPSPSLPPEHADQARGALSKDWGGEGSVARNKNISSPEQLISAETQEPQPPSLTEPLQASPVPQQPQTQLETPSPMPALAAPENMEAVYDRGPVDPGSPMRDALPARVPPAGQPALQRKEMTSTEQRASNQVRTEQTEKIAGRVIKAQIQPLTAPELQSGDPISHSPMVGRKARVSAKLNEVGQSSQKEASQDESVPPASSVKARVSQHLERALVDTQSHEALPLQVRSKLASLLGKAPDDVRLIRNAHAAEATAAAAADALAVGDAVLINPSQDLASPRGLGLLAHELTHVLRDRDPHFVPAVVRPSVTAQAVSAAPLPRDEEALAEHVEASAYHQDVNLRRQQMPGMPPLNTPVKAEENPWGNLPAPWEPLPFWEAPVAPASGPGRQASQDAPVLPAFVMPSVAMSAFQAPSQGYAVRAASTSRAAPSSNSSSGPSGGSASPAQGKDVGFDRHKMQRPIDLDRLAQQVYNQLKKRLALEVRREH